MQITRCYCRDAGVDEREPCEVCGNMAAVWRKCKLICTSCGTILKSCADL